MKSVYCSIISRRDSISFLSGIIMGGYIVEISVQENCNEYHWIAVGCGFVIGILLLILGNISDIFNDNINDNKFNNLGIKRKANWILSWDSINDVSNKTNFQKLLSPKRTVPILFISILSLVFSGIVFIRIGNQENLNDDHRNRIIQQCQVAHKVDSLGSEHRIQINKKLDSAIGKKHEINEEIDELKIDLSGINDKIEGIMKMIDQQQIPKASGEN